MHKMTILYGTPKDAEHFDRYYRETHIPVASAMEGLTRWTLSWMDAASEADSGYHLVAELHAESADALDAILASPAGLAANADLENFVTGTVTFLRGDEVEVPV